MTLADTYNAVAQELVTLASALSAKGDDSGAASVSATVSALLSAAEDANAANLEAKLAADAQASHALAAFTSQAAQKAKEIAREQKAISGVVKLGTDVANMVTAAAAGNLAGGFHALTAMCTDLSISA